VIPARASGPAQRFRDYTLPRLRALLEQHAVLLVLDNLETLLTDGGEWRIALWGDVVAVLLGHEGLSRVVLTSLRAPAAHPRLQREAIHARRAGGGDAPRSPGVTEAVRGATDPAVLAATDVEFAAYPHHGDAPRAPNRGRRGGALVAAAARYGVPRESCMTRANWRRHWPRPAGATRPSG
jgi:hypothetical protein